AECHDRYGGDARGALREQPAGSGAPHGAEGDPDDRLAPRVPRDALRRRRHADALSTAPVYRSRGLFPVDVPPRYGDAQPAAGTPPRLQVGAHRVAGWRSEPVGLPGFTWVDRPTHRYGRTGGAGTGRCAF